MKEQTERALTLVSEAHAFLKPIRGDNVMPTYKLRFGLLCAQGRQFQRLVQQHAP